MQNMKDLLSGWLLSIFLTLLLILLSALIICVFDISDNYLHIMVYFIYLTVSFVSGYWIGRKKERLKFMYGAIQGCCYYVTWLLFVIFSAGNLISVGMLTVGLTCICAGMFGGMLA